MLFGASTAYPQCVNGRIERLQKRYRVLVHEYIAAHGARREAVTAK